MNAHALSVLEFPRVLEIIAGRAASTLGREAVRKRTPGTERADLVRELERVAATMAFLSERPDWGPPPIPDARAALERLDVKDAALDPDQLHRTGTLLSSSRALLAELERRDPRGDRFPALGSVRQLLHVDRDAEKVIERTVDAGGNVLDTASKELARIRESVRRTRARIVRELESFVADLPGRYVVADASVSLRNGRYVIPVRREGRKEVGGIVHDESATGSTLFVEPPLAIDLMNELGELERAEDREVRRILEEITDRLAPDRDALVGTLDALVDFDSLQARARAALAWEGEPPELLEAGTEAFRIVRGRHPLLVEGEEDVVPFELAFEPGERALVVSGPNTGGKSVFLKAMGLLATLAQAGCVPPVGKGTSLPVFTDVFADIGDEQSIAESLSTFSAHLENLKEIVEEADHHSLVVIDEMGTGTDPAEGAALARGILETLVERGALALVTSHLGALKALDREGSGIVNASLQFDPDRMEPTYRFIKGRPGRSYGLAIARRLGFPRDVLDRAEDHLSAGEADVEELLATLERKEKEQAELVASLAEEEEKAARLRRQLEDRQEALREEERTAERRAREEARELLLEARDEVEAAIREVRSVTDSEALEEASRKARRRVEQAARRHGELRPSSSGPRGEPPDLDTGQRVRVAGSGAEGTVVELDDGRAVVKVSGLRMEVPAVELEPVDTASEGNGARETAQEDGGGWTGPAAEADHEIDLRGLRVDEVELELGRGLDAAILGGLGEIKVIHGKGTGAVRARVRELLERDRRVESFRPGRPGEGGTGVTVVEVEP